MRPAAIISSPLLRLALRLDALLSLAAGAATCSLAAPLAGELGTPAWPVWGLGLFMLGYGIAAGVLAARRHLPRWLALGVVIGNALWVVDSLLLFATGWIAPSLTGTGLIVGQALVVAVLTALQGLGLRRSAATPA